ncbi:hypothetical protein HW450_03950 [Corynebacterium hindlerae]|uniref:Uncharacterized protein n=1 Tax=Corynebacterium hindlerae TaxID=699041 RepID=A0A7G5FGZ6_9CORY|nr:hypothetical protein [Corynebacterium hindlerae]QMV85887.1 hypothetical protein HW450_03950 [Corynebacterium hindlerae]
MAISNAWPALRFTGFFGWPSTLVVVLAFVVLRALDSTLTPRPKPLGSAAVAILGLLAGAATVAVGTLPPVALVGRNAVFIVPPVLSVAVFLLLACYVKHFHSGVLLAFWATFCGFIWADTMWLYSWDETGQSGVGVFLFIIGATTVALLLAVVLGIRAAVLRRQALQ